MKRLLKRGKHYHYRLKIPSDLRHIFGTRREIWKSLSTSSQIIAHERCIVIDEQVECFFKFARCNMIPDPEMRAMATTFVCDQLGQFEQARADAVLSCGPVIEWNQLSVECMDRIIEAFQGDLGRRSSFRPQVENMVNAVLDDKHLKITPDSPEYRKSSAFP